jgi:hypothetical protein
MWSDTVVLIASPIEFFAFGPIEFFNFGPI